jgi:cyclase
MTTAGTLEGYDIQMTRAVSEAVRIPVVASGGAGGPEDMLAVLTVGKADAALAASIFHFRKWSIRQVKEFLAEHGVNIRPVVDPPSTSRSSGGGK